jgi:hypothetical protein
VDERPHLQAPVRELAPEACPCYPEFPGEQPVQSQRARIGKLEDNLLAPRGLAGSRPDTPFDAHRDSGIDTHAQATQPAEVKRIHPGGGPVVVLTPRIQVGPDGFWRTTREDGALPCGVADRAAIEEPDVHLPLLGVEAKEIAGGKTASLVARGAMTPDAGRFKCHNAPGDLWIVNGVGGVHRSLPFFRRPCTAAHQTVKSLRQASVERARR